MPKIVDQDHYSREILEGALVAFGEHGYNGLSVREIARSLSVSTGTLYHYFDSKHDLFLHVVDYQTDQLADRLRAHGTGATPSDRLHSLLEHVRGNEAWYIRYNRICLDYLRVRDERGTVVMSTTTERAVDALGDALGIDPAAARFVLVCIFGLVTQRDLDGGATSFDEQARLLGSWVRDGSRRMSSR